MTQEVKIMIAIAIATIALVVGAAVLLGSPKTPTETQNTKVDKKILVKDNNYKIGSSSAKVTVVEFADFQCPACGAAYLTTKQIIKDYDLRILFVFRHFPLPQHKNAEIAAETAEASGEQGKFWEMHDKLFENQDKWSESDKPMSIFEGFAKDLGLDVDKLKSEVEKEKFKNKITKDQDEGSSIGVNSTPTFFINGEQFSGVLSYDEFRKAIEKLLK